MKFNAQATACLAILGATTAMQLMLTAIGARSIEACSAACLAAALAPLFSSSVRSLYRTAFYS